MITIIRKKKLRKLEEDCKEYKRLWNVWMEVAGRNLERC